MIPSLERWPIKAKEAPLRLTPLDTNPVFQCLFGDFHVRHKDWLTYSGGTDRPGELCYNFSISNNLTQITFLLGSLTVTLTVLLFWISFFLLTLVLVLQWLFFHSEILIMLLSQFPLTFQ